MSTKRLTGHMVDEQQKCFFCFNGEWLFGHPGDTLASALLANDQHFVARSFKYHRPRGIFSAGSEEPSALLTIGKGAYAEPNTRATTVELYNGLEATSQHYRGSLKYDLMAINDLFAPFLSAGFYYKTFMWPKSFWEKVYEPLIRKSAGLGQLSGMSDPDNYDHGYLHCDVLIAGGGPSGLMAALLAARAGLRIILMDEDFCFGGRLNAETYEINGGNARAWVNTILKELQTSSNVRIMSRTTVFGAYDHGIYGALERTGDHLLPEQRSGKPRQILWRVYSKHAIVAAGATERSIAFGHNDRPAVMLAGALRAYVNRWGVVPGKAISLFINNDDGLRTAIDLHRKGINVCAVVDSRQATTHEKVLHDHIRDIRYIRGKHVISTKGRHRLKSITLNDGTTIATDCLGVSGGWSPNIHLSCHHRSRPVWQENIAAFVAGDHLPPNMVMVGAANGCMTLGSCLQDAYQITSQVIEKCGRSTPKLELPRTNDDEGDALTPLWHVAQSKGRAWVDLQNDVTAKDVTLSYQEGFHGVELLKRYTTLGMATDQGKNSNIIGLALMAQASGKSMDEVGTTIYRPPYNPIAIGAFAGRARGQNFRPVRHTPSHDWATSLGAVFVETGAWLRAQWYPQKGETHWRESVDREVLQTRESVGICDVSTLGKIDIQGRDAAQFLSRVYINGFLKLAVGKVRYGLMLREDGIAMDDGTTARLGETHYVMTTTTANAVSVFRHLEFCRQCLWPDMDVHLISATEQFAQFAVAGPNSRKVLQKVIDPEYDISNEAFPYMACGEIRVCGGTPARLFRISFSGEMAYEIAVPTRYAHAFIQILMEAGQTFGVVAYGTEALGVMRIEKGHPAGNELSGHTTAQDLGMGKMLSKTKDCIGNVLSERPELVNEDRPRLVGFIPVDSSCLLKAGAHFVSPGKPATMEYDEGWMSSVAWSPELRHSIGLGFIKQGAERMDEVVRAVHPLHGEEVDVKIVSPHFVDPKGERLRG